MKRIPWLATAALLLTAVAARASDPIGIYAVIDKVVLEPKTGSPKRAQVWGVFRLAMAGRGDTYAAPVRGYLYYGLTPGKEGACRKEWADLQRVAGRGRCVGFGSRHKAKGAVRRADQEPKKPDPYPVAIGLERIDNDNPIGKQLRALPRPLEPTEGCLVPPGRVTLRVRALPGAGDSTCYRFEIENSAGEKEASGPITAVGKEARWSPRMKLKAGEKCSWRVWTRGDVEDKTAVTVTPFRVKG
jgi:hypothetical protein